MKKEIIDHYSEIDFALWEEIIGVCFDKLVNLEGKEQRKIWALTLYANYLQLIEIFCLNLLQITGERPWKNLFMGNDILRITIEKELQSSTKLIDIFFDKWVFGIQEKNKIKNIEKKNRQYHSILKEAIEDYIKDYEMLNAYKHGFRVKSMDGGSLSIKKEIEGEETFLIGNYNSKISYLARRKKEILRKEVLFNWESVYQKSAFLLNMLENFQKVLRAKGGEVEIDTLIIDDEKVFSSFFGAARFSYPTGIKIES